MARQVSSRKVNRRSSTLSNNSDIIFNENNSDIQRLMRANGIFDREQMEWYNKFARIGLIDPYNALTNTKEYIFITKPDLYLMNKSNGTVSPILAKNPFFIDAISRWHHSAAQLQSSYLDFSHSSPFMTMLSNSVTSTLDVPGLSADMIDTSGNMNGTKISYRSTSYKSDESHDFNLEFEDDKNLDIYMIFKMWDEYEKLKWSGMLDFSSSEADETWQNYIINKVLHDQVSIYKFIVAEDGYRIVYYARIVGCVPTSIPRDAFSDTSSTEPQKLTVGWRGHFVRDMDPIILNHFNTISMTSQTSGNYLPLFDDAAHGFNGNEWASAPYVYTKESERTGRKEYFLRWMK